METLKFTSSALKMWLLRIDFLIASLIWLVPFGLVWFGRGFDSAFQQYFLDIPYHSSSFAIFFIFTSASVFLVFLRVVSYSQRYPILINDCEIMQVPWFGKTRKIKWDGAERIQVFDGVDARGQYYYRIRIFSKELVIVFANKFKDIDNLISRIREQAKKHEIPIYLEDKMYTLLKFGSWDIDAAGKSNGIPVKQIAEIPMPKNKKTLRHK